MISSALILKNIPENKARVYYSSPPFLRDTICKSLLGRRADEIYIADLSPNREAMAASSVYSRAYWFDHHTIEPIKAPENVSLYLNSSAESAAKVVAEYFKFEDELVDIANQIDRNSVESLEAEQLRCLVGYLKKYTQGIDFALKMRSLAISLAEKGLEKILSQQENLEAIGKYQNYLQELSKNIEEKTEIYDVMGKKVAIYVTDEFNPVYFITNQLKEHNKAPFDYIVVVVHRKQKSLTKLEFRTHTGEDVLSLARFFGGGGHKVASGATVAGNTTQKEIINAIESLQTG